MSSLPNEITDIWNKAILLFSKIGIWLLLIGLGMLGHFSTSLLLKKQLSLGQYLGSFGTSFFVGCLVAILCNNFGWIKVGQVVVPLSTLLSREIIIALFSINWRKNFQEMASDLFKRWSDKLKK